VDRYERETFISPVMLPSFQQFRPKPSWLIKPGEK